MVKAGDTLLRIALDHGQNWRDIARWNGLENPNLIEVGQVLRVSPLASEGAVAEPKPVTLSGQVETRPLATSPAAQARAQAPPVAPDAVSSGALEAIDWGWPAGGPLISPYEEGRGLKGLSLGGKLGDPVLAAADGRVIYAGAGLRGYGNLVIVRHNGNFLSAYAHNQNLLVKEDQAVRKGQRIADMGSSDTDRVKLHFEIRRNGLPVDPARYLPAR